MSSGTYMHTRAVLISIALFAPRFVIPGSAAVTNMAVELEEDHEISMAYETPHTDWAQPYAQGTTRMLYFGYGGSGRGVEARDLVELMQRFDLEAEAAFFQKVSDTHDFTWIGGKAGTARLENLVGEQDWDCYLFNGVSPETMPAYRLIRDRFTRHVHDDDVPEDIERGGIVLIGVDDAFLTMRENRVSDAQNPVPGADAFETDFGRVVRMPPRPKIPFSPGWDVAYDHWMEQVGRAILWVAYREPDLELAITMPRDALKRASVPDTRITLTWSGEPVGDDLGFSARIRRDDGEILDLQVEAPGPGQHEMSVPIPRPLRAGMYRFDGFASSSRGVEAWMTAPLEITSTRTVADLSLDAEWGENGDTMTGRVTVSGDPLPRESVIVRLVDVHGRVLNESSVKVGGSTALFSFPVEDWMPMLLEVRAVLTSEGEDVSSNHAYYHVVRRKRGQFNFVVWVPGGSFSAADWPYDTLAPYVHRQLARLGCTAVLIGTRSSFRGWPYLPVAAADIALVPYATRLMTGWDEDGFMTIPHTTGVCWNNEEAIGGLVADTVRKCRFSRRHGVFVYGLGDEGASSGSCVHPICLDAYRGYLENEYGDIARLNRSWDSDYGDFDEVDLLVPGDNEEEEALRRGLKARWYDRQAFQSHNLVKFARTFADGFRTLDPESISGYEGSGRFADGADIDLVCRTLEYWAPYPGLQDEVVRSITPPEFVNSNWMGYHKGTEDLLGQYWRMVTLGFDSVWFWRWSGMGPYEAHPSYHGLLNGSMVPWRAVQTMLDDTRIVRDGLGTLLLQSKREDDGIAMLYSFPSQFAIKTGPGLTYGDTAGHEMNPLKSHPELDGKESLIVYEKNHISWHRSLRAAGLQFSYVTDRMLRSGEFDPADFKVMILSQIEALGAAEADILRTFVENGGTLIADVRPGVYDGHCKPAARGMLDDLFGIQRTGDAAARIERAQIDGSVETHSFGVAFEDAKVDPAIRVTDGNPLGRAGDVPLCIARTAGKGRAILLNFAMDSYPVLNTEEVPEGAHDFVRTLLRASGVTPRVTVTGADGDLVRDTEIIRWSGPGVDFVTLFGAMSLRGRKMMYVSKDETVGVTLPAKKHVYDLREGIYRGEVDSFPARKLGNRATWLVISDHALSSPVAKARGAPWKRGTREALDVSFPDRDATRAVKLEVLYPDGSHAEWLDRVLIVPAGGAQVVLPIAYNDPPGEWTLRASDLYTGGTTVTQVPVR